MPRQKQEEKTRTKTFFEVSFNHSLSYAHAAMEFKHKKCSTLMNVFEHLIQFS